ncbi:MAG: nitrite reductase [Thermoplasmataceae archaeon]
MDERIERRLQDIVKALPSEEMYFEALRDIIKDIIKEYLRKQINQNAELKKGIAEALRGFMEAKLKEYDSMARMAKLTASLSLLAAPESVKDEAVKDFASVFQKEIEEIIRRTF